MSTVKSKSPVKFQKVFAGQEEAMIAVSIGAIQSTDGMQTGTFNYVVNRVPSPGKSHTFQDRTIVRGTFELDSKQIQNIAKDASNLEKIATEKLVSILSDKNPGLSVDDFEV